MSRSMAKLKSPPNSSWYVTCYIGHSFVRLLCGNVWQIRSNRRQGNAIKTKNIKAGLVKLERITAGVYDILKQNVVHLLPLSAFPQHQTEILLIEQSWSGCLLNRFRPINFHANVLIIVFEPI